MNQASDMLLIQSLAFLEKKVTIFRKNLKIDNYSYRIKTKTRQNKELKYCQKNIVLCPHPSCERLSNIWMVPDNSCE